MRTYNVPVIFTIRATDRNAAEQKMNVIVRQCEEYDQLPEWYVGVATQDPTPVRKSVI